jgi:MFS family permease
MKILDTLKSYSNQFWLLNSIQTIERLAYWIVLLQMPVYIAQKDLPGGLHWEQAIKGLIFFWWALIQNVSPAITGGLADRFGRKKTMIITSLMIITGFILLGCFRTFYPFLFSTLLLGLGMGVFKPALQGQVSQNISRDNTTLGWGIYTTFVNIAYFLGPTCSVFLKSFDWQWIFFGSAAVHSVNLILLCFVKENKETTTSEQHKPKVLHILADTFKNMLRPDVLIFLVFATGFTLNHMQFYETLPNFVMDWSDTSHIAKYLPQFMQYNSPRGTMVAFEWIYNINSTMLVLCVALVAYLTRNRNLLRVCSLGVLLASVGLFIAGRTMNGTLLISGVFMLAIGEILITPRISEYFSRIAPPESRSQFLGYANIAWALGLSGGGIVGGYLYQHLGEKSSFAIKYLSEHFGIANATHNDALTILMQKTGMNATEVTQLLWDTYNPWHFWLPFLIMGLLGSIGFLLFNRYKRKSSN